MAKPTETENRLRNNLSYTRKADGFDDVAAIVTPTEIKAQLGDDKLPIFSALDLYAADTEPHPMVDFTREDLPIVFGLMVGPQMYLVNTEGYTYCRYVARVMSPVSKEELETFW